MPFHMPDSYKHCGAKTRAATPCKSPAMQNGRCRMHGGKTPYSNLHPHTKSGKHSRYTWRYQKLQKMPLCGAKTRAGTACKNRAMRGRKRCRMHGGKALQGMQSPNFKHGAYANDWYAHHIWSSVQHEWRLKRGMARVLYYAEQHPAPGISNHKSERAYRQAFNLWIATSIAAGKQGEDRIPMQLIREAYETVIAELPDNPDPVQVVSGAAAIVSKQWILLPLM